MGLVPPPLLFFGGGGGEDKLAYDDVTFISLLRAYPEELTSK